MSVLFIDVAGQELTQEEVELLSHPLVAGVILFTRNFYDVAQIQALVRSIRQRVNKRLLITVDQEGGRVQRFRPGFTLLPAMQAISQLIEDPTQQCFVAQEAGWQMAAEMTALDIDISFAPVLDLGHCCKAIGDRSFSEDWKTTTVLAEAFIRGMNEAGMAATGKHFPGHGHVIADSHLETPYDTRSKQEIFSNDAQPFIHLIQQNRLQAVMPAHVIYTQCDSQPASGSRYWLQQILRQQMGFNGVIFSDDLGMKGADFMGDFVSRCARSMQAGCDFLLLCNERQGVIEVLDNFKPDESHEHANLRANRLKPLFKQIPIELHYLQQTDRWLENNKNLTALQQNWLATKA